MSSIYGPGGAKSTCSNSSPGKKRPRTNESPKNNVNKTTTHSLSHVVVRYNKRLWLETQRVPWIDFFELQAVGRSLLSILETCNSKGSRNSNSSTNSNNSNIEIGSNEIIIMPMEDALERVELWKARCCGGLDLPHAIESTAALAQILWKESISSSSSSSSYSACNYTFLTMELRLSYASAVIRTINGLVDYFQQERVVATSVAHICELYLNIPSWLVDVRHEATHNQLPTLAILRMAARYMLQYLANTYWQPLQQGKLEEQNVIVEYLQVYEEIVTSSSTLDATMKSDNGERATTSITDNASKVKSSIYRIGKMKGSDESDQRDHHDSDEDDNPLLLRSRLGTNINMFAVLMESKKDKKKKKRKLLEEEQQAKAEAERLEKEETELNRAKQEEPYSWKTSPTACAEQLVKACTASMMIPIDVIWTIMLSHFIWRPRTTTTISTAANNNNNMSCTYCCNNIHHHNNCCRGVLVPTCLQSFPPTMKSVCTLRNRYRPLLKALGQQWPVLMSALLVHIVDGMIMLETKSSSSSSSSSCGAVSPACSPYLLSNNQSMDNADGTRGGRGDEYNNGFPITTPTFQTIARQGHGLYFLDSWARFLLSSSFLVDSLGLQEHEQKQQQQPNKSTNNSSSKKSDDEPASRAILQSVMQYPLNSLCDRLLSLSENAASIGTTITNATSSCLKLSLYLQDILGDDRYVNFGVAITEEKDVLYRSLSAVGNANADNQTNCINVMAMNDTNSSESAPVVFGPCLPNEESSSSEEDNSTKDEHDDQSDAMDQTTMECDDAPRPGEYVAAMDVVHGPKPVNDVAVYEEEKRSSGIQPSMETETQIGQTADSHVNNKAKHDDTEGQGEPRLTGGCDEPRAAGSSLSLAQMEALLFKQSNAHKQDDDNISQETATAHYNEPHMLLQNVLGETVPVTNTATAVPDTQQRQQRQQRQQQQERSPWVKCLAWDACAIGSLPGYPL